MLHSDQNLLVKGLEAVDVTQRDFSVFFGLDLGGGKGKNTAVARLEMQADGAHVSYVSTKNAQGKPFFDDVLVEYLTAHQDRALLAVDAPLMASVCMRCRLPHCPGLGHCPDPVVHWFREQAKGTIPPHKKPPFTAYTQRACEVLLKDRHGITPRETLGQGMGPLTARAHYLRRVLAPKYKINENLIEVYPKATVTMLCGAERARRYKREVNTWATRAAILEQLSQDLHFDVWREGCLKNDHCFDAVICAYTGYLWARDGWQITEEDKEIFEQDGWIWFPPKRSR